MSPAQRELLCAIHARSVEGARHEASAREAAALGALADSGLIARDGSALTDAGRARLRVVLSGGVFDIIHPGHIHTLRQARAHGDMLVVVVATDATAVKMKKRTPLHAQDERVGLVRALRMVDACIVGDEEDIFRTVRRVGPQVIALGYDQAHQESYIRGGCERIGVDAQVVRLDAKDPGLSSSAIEREYGSSIHGI